MIYVKTLIVVLFGLFCLHCSSPTPSAPSRNYTFFGMKMEGKIIKNKEHNVDCALVGGLISDQIVCACVIHYKKEGGKMIVWSKDYMCTNSESKGE